MTRRTPEADIQRAIVHTLRVVLPREAIIHHSANEVGSGGKAARQRQAILTGMGVFPGFADLIILTGGRVLFLEVKSQSGRLSPAQRDFRDRVQAQGFGWALIRSVEDALGALADHGITTRVQALNPRRRAHA
ncbi:VRR-NUC domain-containing protein [Paracoccus sp. R12_1]|uniref:VRR-NUC domain-containing protein n=1 Tax=unclassified Paracoccus (in: a-proteobacteria) TaxID=2688777 RepID=UPI001AD959C2|nr:MULTISPECIES: VRR-NUC domain-containing protein [unclassified Paracoccus (in: a-proteobacteria)]MBO9457016.1 VRR-NUC domain-containing protein [Paracoccus sp. R12_2]MBO9488099.1 VRR-NUC domain-containing protein [Paracoccus sp. R12_1]